MEIPRFGPQYFTSREARQLAGSKTWWHMFKIFSFACMGIGFAMFLAPDTMENIIIMLIFMVLGVPSTIIALTLHVPRDYTIWLALKKSDRFHELLEVGDELAAKHKELEGMIEGFAMFLAQRNPFTDVQESQEQQSEITTMGDVYLLEAQGIHEAQRDLLDPLYRQLGKPNPLRYNTP